MNTTTAPQFALVKTSTRRVIWKCGCGVKAIDYTATRTLSYVDRVFGTPHYTEARLTRVVDGVERPESHDFKCPSCKRERRGTVVKGRVSEHKCNAKCLASKSGVCECSCGGKNHGKNHL